jgi:hypothetical protein
VKSRARLARVRVVADGGSLISSAGGALLTETARLTGLNRRLSRGLRGWRGLGAVHDPGKIVQDLASALALGGDCLADIAVVRAQSELFGQVASDPTVSRLIDKLATDVDSALAALRSARADARAVAWQHRCPVPTDELVPVDIDGTIVVAHSEKESAAATFKRTFGFHPLLAFIDHGPDGDGGGGEPLAAVLRPGSANANTAADHIAVLDLALAQLPEQVRSRVLVRTDSGGGTKAFLRHVTELGLQYSTGIGVAIGIDQDLLGRLAPKDWTAALDSNGQPRQGAQVAELTQLLPDLAERGWPAGMRLIARRERPHPGAQLRLTDINGWRVTVFATNSPGTDLAQLEVTHRLRARAEDRIRGLKDSGLRNLPLHDFAQNQIWLETVLLAADLLAWTATLALTTHRKAEPKRLRLRVLHVAARVVRSGRTTLLKLPTHWPWADEIVTAHARLRALPTPP